MMSPFGLAFAVVFIAGPVLFAILARLPGRALTLAVISGSAVAIVSAALILQSVQPALSLMCLWLAWVLALAVCFMALRPRLPGLRARRLAYVAGLLATTLPWFGLATAQMVTT